MWLFPGMYERCPACGLKFEREQGYFLGAMYIGYGLGIGAIAAARGAGVGSNAVVVDEERGGGIVLFLPLAPVLTWMSRVLWIWMDQGIDPDKS